MKIKDLLPRISHRKHPRYSRTLFRWLKGHWLFEQEIFVVPNTADNTLFIGRFEKDLPPQESFCGAPLMSVLSGGKKTEALFYSNSPVYEKDIDHDFWPRYIRDGRCAIDQEHSIWFPDDRTRWVYSGDGKHRSCLWCGNHTQVLHEWQETVTKTEWRPSPDDWTKQKENDNEQQ